MESDIPSETAAKSLSIASAELEEFYGVTDGT